MSGTSNLKKDPSVINVEKVDPNRKSSKNLLPALKQKTGDGKPNAKNEAKSEYEEEHYMGVNQVLVYNFKGCSPTYYVPAYLRMRISRVNEINYIESKAQIQTEIRIWLMIKDFPEVVQDQIINQAKININGSVDIELDQIREPLKLDQSQIRNKSKSAVGFLLSQQMELSIQSNAFWSPFELVKLYANLEIKKIVLGTGNQKYLKDLKQDAKKELKPGDVQKYADASVEFNFLDAHPFLQFSFGEVRSLGTFDIAESLVDMKFSNDSIQSDDAADEAEEQVDIENEPMNIIGKALNLQEKLKKQKLESGQISPDAYEHGQILIPLYKYPSTTIINVFVPLYMVAVMSLGVFFEGNDMSNRDGSLATFLLAYIAFLPSIRESLPETPKIVFTEILVYLQITTSLICFFYSLTVNFQEGYTFQWEQTPAFLACVALTLLNMVVVIGMFLIHKIVWERQYNKLPKGSLKYMNCKTLNTDDNKEWWNKECDEEFKDAIQLGLVKPYIVRRNRKKSMKGLFSMIMGGNNQEESGIQLEDTSNTKVHPEGLQLIK